MARVFAYRIGVAILAIVAFCLLWSLAYEVVVGWRWAPSQFQGEGSTRWALLRAQNADRSAGFALMAWTHFCARLFYPPTQIEALMRAGIAAGVVTAIGAGLALFAFVNRRQMPFGAARFGTLMEAAKAGLTKKQGIILGRLNGVTIRSDEPAHILVVGPSRSGKGTGFVLPNGYFWQGSAVFFDPKRENFQALAAYRTAMGNKVFLFSPGSPDTHRYNPLDFVRRDERMATDCLVVASFVIPEKADDTWAGAGRLLLSALIGYVLASPLTAQAQHMRSVARMTTTGKDISTVLRAIVKTESQHLPTWIIDSFNQYIALEPETRNSAVFNVNMAMSLWNNGLISAATETSDFDIRQLRRHPMTIFIGCTIAELSIFRPLIRILFQQIHDLLMERLPGSDEPHQVLLMLDEFYHVGRMDALISKITISAGFGFRMAIIIQDLAQLDELYGKSTRVTTVSGSQIKLFIQINDLETSEFVSEMLGETTQVYKTPVTRPGQGLFAPRAWSPHYTPRRLRSPLELREMSARLAILIVKNSPSFELTKIRHYADRPYRTMARTGAKKPPPVPKLQAYQDNSPIGVGNPRTSPVASDAAVAHGDPAMPPRRIEPPSRQRTHMALGKAPDPIGESCNLQDILASAKLQQDGSFSALAATISPQSETFSPIKRSVSSLENLNRSFGEDDNW